MPSLEPQQGAPTPSAAVTRTEASDSLEAIWNQMDALTREKLTLQLGQLVEVTVGGQKNLRNYVLEMIVSLLDLAAGHTSLNLDIVVPPFMTILRDGPIESLREMKARADDMWNTRDELMAESDSEGESDVIVTNSPWSNGDTPMPRVPDTISISAGSASDASMRSTSSNTNTQSAVSNITMDDAFILPNNESI